MTEKEFIDNLNYNNSDYNNPELAIASANMCNTISRDINTDSQRFIYELLQNADDASNKNNRLDIQISFSGDFIIVSHKGEPFSEVDIESISSAGDGTKTGDSNKTGFKGIGFKSVFSQSDYVIIKSQNFCFRYDRSHWGEHWNDKWGNKDTWQSQRRVKSKSEQPQMPWQIIPIWHKLKDNPFWDEYNVSTIIKHNQIEKLKRDLSILLSGTQIVLFLRSKEVVITVNSDEKLIIEKSTNLETKTITLKRNGELQSEWIIKTEQFDIPLNTREEINADEKSPQKLKDSLLTEISFAIQVEQGELKAVSKPNRLIFTYLPTSINYDFPFLVNASFLTDAGRQHLHQDVVWNNWLFNQIPLKFFKWVAELADRGSDYRYQFLKILPHKLSGSNMLEQNFNEGYKQALNTISFIPNQNGDLLKVSEAIFDKTSISDWIEKQIFVNHVNQKLQKNFTAKSFIPHIEPINTLKKIGVEMFVIDDLEELFASTAFINEHKIVDNYNLICFLYDKVNDSNDGEEWNRKFKNIPFIFNKNLNLCKPIHLLLGQHSRVTDEQIIHSDVLCEVRNNREIYNWLLNLGVQEPSDTAFIDLIIENPETFINISNAIDTIRFIFNIYRNNQISDSQFQELRKIKLLTKKGTLLSCEKCYLSNFYDPELKLEQLYGGDVYVDEKYVEGKDEKVEWKAFFLRMKVKQQIGKYELNNRPSLQSLIASFGNDYFDIDNGYIARFRTGYGYRSDNEISFLRNLSFLEYTVNNVIFAKLFWKSVIFTPELDLNYLNEKPTLYYGTGSWYNRFSVSITETYFQWFVLNKNCIPTTQGECKQSKSVYFTIEIKEIAGKYLPVFDYELPIDRELREFFGFIEHLNLDDYLTILKNISNDTDLNEEEQKENQKRVKLIYGKLALLTLSDSEKEVIKSWGKTNKLLAKSGNVFFEPKDLSVVTVKGFKASNLAHPDGATSEIIEILRLFGVRIVDKITPDISDDKTEVKELKNQLIRISPLIALISVEKSKALKDWEDEYNQIYTKLQGIYFYKTSKIDLSYGNENDKQSRSSWSEKNTFYYVGNWSSLRTLDGLVEPLCKFLNIGYAERILIVLLLETFKNSIEYLKEKGYDVSLIPEDKFLLEENDDNIYSQDDIREENRPYNPSDEALGRKGEEFVYDRLQKIYTGKYKSSPKETSTGFKIISVPRTEIGNKKVDIVEVFWLNKEHNTTANHDFRIRENGREIYIDSKATPFSKSKEKVPFYMSSNELALMKKANKYLIARVFNVTTEPVMEFIKLAIDDLN